MFSPSVARPPETLTRCKDERHAVSNDLETMKGSGSLLSTSQSDNWDSRQRTPWQSLDNKSPSISKVGANRSGTSPNHFQNNSQPPPTSFLGASSDNSMYFSVIPSNQGISKIPGTLSKSDMPDTNGVLRSSRHNSDEENRLLTRPAAFGGNDTGFPIQLSRQSTHNSASGFSSSVASRSGSLPPSRNEGDSQLRYDDIHHTTYPNFIQPSTNIMQHQHTLSPQALAFSKVQGVRSSKYGHAGSHASLNSLSEDFGNMKVGKGNKALDTASRESQYGLHNMSPYEYGQAAEAVSTNGAWEVEENNYDQSSEPFGPNFVPAGVIPLHAQHRHSAFNTSAVHTPTSSDNRQSQRSPYYSQGGTPPYGPKSRAPSHSSFNENVPTGQAMLLERKLRGLQQVQQEQQGHMQPQPNPMHFRSALPNNYDFLPQSSLRMNPIHNYYPLAPVPSLLTHVPRGPARGRDLGQNTRSALLEKFKSDSKPQKTWELKVSAGNLG